MNKARGHVSQCKLFLILIAVAAAAAAAAAALPFVHRRVTQDDLRRWVNLDREHDVENELHVLDEARDEEELRRRGMVVDCWRTAADTGKNEAISHQMHHGRGGKKKKTVDVNGKRFNNSEPQPNPVQTPTRARW